MLPLLQHSLSELFTRRRGRPIDKPGTSFASLITGYHERYNAPIMITETSARGSEQTRSAWLDTSLGAIRGLRQAGVPVIGYTWFPMFTMINWSYRLGTRPSKEYRLELALYRLDEQASAARWSATPLVAQFQQLCADPEATVGRLPELAEHKSVSPQLEPSR